MDNFLGVGCRLLSFKSVSTKDLFLLELETGDDKSSDWILGKESDMRLAGSGRGDPIL